MEVDMQKLLGIHRRTFPIETPVGTVVLRALPKIEAQRIHGLLKATYPDYEETMESIDFYKKISDMNEAKGIEPVLNLEQAKEYAILKNKIAPYMDHFSVGCFVKPKMTKPEDVMALADVLPGDVWREISILLVILSNPLPLEETHFNFIRTCKEFGIALSDDLTAEVMTVHQSYLLEETLRREAAEAKKIWEEVLS